jgi:hypothetical protein
MALIDRFGEMWARNAKNIGNVPGRTRGHGQGVYILYDGSTPVYVGKGNIRNQLRGAQRGKRRKNSWDYFSWFIIKNQDKNVIHDVEVLLLRILPPYLRHLNRQAGKFTDAHSTDPKMKDSPPIHIQRPWLK